MASCGVVHLQALKLIRVHPTIEAVKEHDLSYRVDGLGGLDVGILLPRPESVTKYSVLIPVDEATQVGGDATGVGF